MRRTAHQALGLHRRPHDSPVHAGRDGAAPRKGVSCGRYIAGNRQPAALREYLANYLRNCPDVRSDLMLMVRTLQPTSEGVPLEFYCFTRHFEWIPYEAFQSALTDRVLTLLPEFGLQAFQRPAGTDLHERH